MGLDKKGGVTVGDISKCQVISWTLSSGEMYNQEILDGSATEMDIAIEDILEDEAGFLQFIEAVKNSIKETN